VAQTDNIKRQAVADKERLQKAIDGRKAMLAELEMKLQAAQEDGKSHEGLRRRAEAAHAQVCTADLVSLVRTDHAPHRTWSSCNEKRRTLSPSTKPCVAPAHPKAQLEDQSAQTQARRIALDEALRKRNDEVTSLQVQLAAAEEAHAHSAARQIPATIARSLHTALVALHSLVSSTHGSPPQLTLPADPDADASREVDRLLSYLCSLMTALPRHAPRSLADAEARSYALQQTAAADRARYTADVERERAKVARLESSIVDLERRIAQPSTARPSTPRRSSPAPLLRGSSAASYPRGLSSATSNASTTPIVRMSTSLELGGDGEAERERRLQEAMIKRLGAMLTTLAKEHKELVDEQGASRPELRFQAQRMVTGLRRPGQSLCSPTSAHTPFRSRTRRSCTPTIPQESKICMLRGYNAIPTFDAPVDGLESAATVAGARASSTSIMASSIGSTDLDIRHDLPPRPFGDALLDGVDGEGG
jgi:hypothetical protein